MISRAPGRSAAVRDIAQQREAPVITRLSQLGPVKEDVWRNVRDAIFDSHPLGDVQIAQMCQAINGRALASKWVFSMEPQELPQCTCTYQQRIQRQILVLYAAPHG